MFRAFRLLNFRRVRRQPFRALIAVVAVAAGISLGVSVVILTRSTSASLSAFGRSLSGPTALRVVGATTRAGLDESVLPAVARTEGVGAAIPVVQAVTYVETTSRNIALVFGVDCSVQAIVGPFNCTPQALAAAPPLEGASLLRQTGAGAVLRTDQGRIPLTNAVSLPALDRVNGGDVVVLALPVAQRLFNREHRLDAIYIQPAPGVSVGALRARLTAAVGGWDAVLGAADPPPGAGAVSALFIPLFTLLSIFALAIGVILVFNTMSLSLEDRRRDLAVVGALGGPPRTIVGATVLEGGTLGLAGGLLGTGAAVLLAHPLTAAVSSFTRRYIGAAITVHVAAGTLAIGAVLGVLVGASASWLPARRATRMDVAAELSQRDLRAEAAPPRKVRRVVVWSAVGLAGVGLCYVASNRGGIEPWQAGVAPVGFVTACLGFIVAIGAAAALVAEVASHLLRRADGPVRMGASNLVRDPGRTGVMTAAIAAAVVTGFIVAASEVSIHDTIAHQIATGAPSEVAVSTLPLNSSVNLDARVSSSLITQLRAVPGVAAVDRYYTLVTGHRTSDLIGIEAADRPQLTQYPLVLGTKDRASFDSGKVLIGVALARRQNLRPGDQVRLDTATGYASVPIGGVWENGDFGGDVVTMPAGLLQRLYGEAPSGVGLVAAPGVSVNQVAVRVVALHLDPYLLVQTPSQLTAKLSKQISQNLAAFVALQRGLLVVAFVAVLSTLLLVGAQRRRELGLLAAVGMEPRQLARMTIAEAGTVGVIALILSVLSGVLLNIAFLVITPVVVGYRDTLRFGFSSLIIDAPVTLVIVLLAALLPAWRTSRLPVLEALQYE